MTVHLPEKIGHCLKQFPSIDNDDKIQLFPSGKIKSSISELTTVTISKQFVFETAGIADVGPIPLQTMRLSIEGLV